MAPHRGNMAKRPMTDICQACTSTGMKDCDMRAAKAAGMEVCSNCEQKRMAQRRNGAKKLCQCLETPTTIDEYFQARGQPVPFHPGGYGMLQMGYQGPSMGYQVPPMGYGMPSVGFGMPSMAYGMPQMGQAMPQMGYGMPPLGYGMPSMGYGMPQMPPAGAQPTPPQAQGKRKREDNNLGDETRKVQERIEKQRRLNSLRSNFESVTASPEVGEHDGDREANRARRETEAQRQDRDRLASVQRGHRQQSTYQPPNPNSMVDCAARSARLERENKSRMSGEVAATQPERQADDAETHDDGEAAALQTMHERQDYVIGASRPQIPAGQGIEMQPEQERDDSDSELDTWHDAPED
ncbi:hypothetical protein KC343_g8501 [Hortaea werneckii]|nr:hypothetical protein KC352_g18847 [Hortaea werneckii]KAI7554488.1 hypothetical protein KC317_g13249 [Hortaea werneckii]KAI7620016.1 hypothetical protein KC343_g8501 [Hortaea werneckii]KAI7620704.1 hypothetical protein KC346_g3971 [Hortaea werneckii]KAI7677006.1 hypothetical protein KC319_g4143 [Hortaea werneckii]